MTFNPMVKQTTIRIVLTLALTEKWMVRQLDVSNAFLNEDQEEEVFITQLQGFVHPQFPNHIFRLKKALYGIK